ncbi:hypothetical protein QOT17_000945 [Balamuthia mandrillaris]
MFVDPERKVYDALRLIHAESFSQLKGQPSPYVKSGFMGGMAWSLKKVFASGLNTGDFKQLGGEFVVGPGPVCHYVHRHENPSDVSNIDTLLEAAGCKPPPQQQEEQDQSEH